MQGAELPSNDPKIIAYRTPAFEGQVRIENAGMDSLTPAQRESMLVTFRMFTSVLYMGVDEQSLQGAGATPSDVFKHLRYRIGQVGSSIADGSITQDPEQTSPSPSIAMKVYGRELAAASLNTQEGIETTKQRLILYARSANAMADTIEQFKAQPKSKETDEIIEGLTRGMFKLYDRMLGLDEALGLIEGRSVIIPPEVQQLTEHFGQEATDQETK